MIKKNISLTQSPTQSPTPALPQREGVADKTNAFRNGSAPSLWGRVGVGLLLCLALSGCIEPYEAEIDGIDSILVVEGMITSGITQINLTKSIEIQDDFYRYMWNGNEDLIYVNNASVYVECDDGSHSEAAHSSGKGVYLIETGELNINAKYRLAIHVDDEVYHSDFLAPTISQPVELSYRINYEYFKNDENEVDSLVNSTDVFVSTQGYERQSGYYLWSYKEDWEYHALMYSAYHPYDCWGKDSSRVFILGSTERLSENTIREQKILTIYGTDNKVSFLYRIRIKQNTIHKEAYDYFNNQKKNSEQTGSLFGVIPSELMGNIKCTSNPGIYVIGYVDVSTATGNELYLTRECFNPQSELLRWRACSEEEKPPLSCMDCTWYSGGTVERPKDWND